MGNTGGAEETVTITQSAVSNGSNSTICEQGNTSTHIFFVVVYSLVFVVGLLLNGFTLNVYFFRAQRNASSVTIFLKNLAAADFLISLCLPMRIMKYANVKSVIIRQVYCNFGASAFYLNMYASIMFMGYIAANRYLKIVHTLETHILQTVRGAHIISTVTWVVLLAVTSSYILVSLLTQQKQNITKLSCDELHSEQLSMLYKVIHIFSATIFLAVLVCLVFFYYKTSRRLSLAQQKHPASVGSKKLARSRRNMLVLVSVFCICFVPYHLVRLPYAYISKRMNCSWHQVFFYLKELAVFVSVLNVCLDPLIYFIFCKAFRARLSLRRMFSNTEVSNGAANRERRSSNEQTSSIRRKISLTTVTKNSVL
ncbi:P2Y purinoceptor 14-like [Archocentrus centrarchus]|uniref:P2Y purinoceptor 14-like n=1 Tax=Archocentrus centrarchus TaxID=63155 RepID=UPI0011E9F221|nr:P2Y purinoceptor 14-like [Archocentrus centrarchus]